MRNPCKIGARKSNANNIENDAKMEVEIHRKYMQKSIQKHITENDAKMKRPKAMDPKGR